MDRKKIAIQTQTPYNNYGGILQAFALQKILISWDYEVVILSTRRNVDSNLKGIKGFFKDVIQKIKYSEYFKKKKQLDTLMAKDLNQYLKMSSFLPTYDKWCQYIKSENFDILIAGSDQIWRLDYNREQLLESYLVYNKSRVRKISYAASLGVSDLTDELKNLMEKYLPSFDAISVREQDSVELLKKIGIEATLCLDPTLLLSSDDYIKMFNLKDEQKNQVFLYSLGTYINDLKLKGYLDTKSEVKRISGDLTIYNYNDSKFFKPSFVEWVQHIYSSEIVVTDSFHGMVFAIIFKKPFYVIVNHGRGASRFTSLLSQLGLTERIWDGKSSVKIKQIEYTDVYEKLENQKIKSMEFLRNNLK